MNQEKIEAIARQIHLANVGRKPFVPLKGDDQPSSLEEAYDIQDALYRLMESVGEAGSTGGHKIALTSPDIQELCGVGQPVYGRIFAKTIHHSPHKLNQNDFVRIGIEFEVAFEMADDVPMTDAPFDSASIAPYVKSAIPAFEIIEDRNADYAELDAHSILTDRCWCGGIILGRPVENWNRSDIGNLASSVEWNGEVVDQGNTGSALGHPLNGLAWVANHLAMRGQSLRAGEVVMTGSALKTRFPKPGDRCTYTIDGLGSVSMEVLV